MKKSLLALASGAFILGAAEFVMMGILPQAAAATGVDIPTAGHYISAYAIGVCFGTLILVFGRKVPPKDLIIVFMVIALVGNLFSAFSANAAMLVIARFISGLPHGAFFGTATLIAKTLADKGKEAQAVSIMVTGQTLANMLGVPAGTLMAEFLSWRLAFGILAAWAAMTMVLSLAWIPFVAPIKDAGIAGQFKFLTRRGPWAILAAVFTGNAGVFCWWSYISPWLQKTGGWSSSLVPMLMMLAGFGMVVGGIIGGRITDRWRQCRHCRSRPVHLLHWSAACGAAARQPWHYRVVDILDRIRIVLHLRTATIADDRGRSGRRRTHCRSRRTSGIQFWQCHRLACGRCYAHLILHELPLHRFGWRSSHPARSRPAHVLLMAMRNGHRSHPSHARNQGRLRPSSQPIP